MIRSHQPGWFREVSAPEYGNQDRGHSPGGPQDRFSWSCARILLGDGPELRTWELISPPRFEITVDCEGVLTGGEFDQLTLDGRPIPHAEVFHARAGQTLHFGVRTFGFRSVLALRPLHASSVSRLGVRRGSFSSITTWPDPRGRIRVTDGPEAKGLPYPDAFLAAPWLTSLQSSEEGVLLQGGDPASYRGTASQMISAPVGDGTLQLTPRGMILLLRSRPTMGGYPRVFTVIDADLDLAAQVPPRRRMRFARVSLAEARQIKILQQEDLRRLRETLGGNQSENSMDGH